MNSYHLHRLALCPVCSSHPMNTGTLGNWCGYAGEGLSGVRITS